MADTDFSRLMAESSLILLLFLILNIGHGLFLNTIPDWTGFGLGTRGSR